MRFVLIIALLGGLTSCSWKSTRTPSVLIIAAESLGFESLSCALQENRDRQGFSHFCEESVRFTHAFTPSVLSQPALTSVFTARFPSEHHVWHNGNQFLSAEVKTAAEAALNRGYRTAFFSGGPPIWRKSGLSQGFEIFEDNIQVGYKLYHRPVLKSFNRLLHWTDQLSRRRPFFAGVYVPDLQFPDQITVTDYSEVRSRSFESQLQELDESLAFLVESLKRRNRWDNTYVILVGLNGRPTRERPGEFEGVNLFSENTQVALFIKPARKKRDKGIEWKIDRNVSLVDLGATLFDLLGEKTVTPSGRELQVTSLLGALEKPRVDWDADRLIPVESGWAQWRGVSNTRFSVRKNQFLLVFDEQLQIFNSLIDRLESSPVSEESGTWSDVSQSIIPYLESRGYTRWSSIPDGLVEKLTLGKELWRDKKPSDEVMQRLNLLIQHRTWDRQLLGWKATLALEKGDWRTLKELGKLGDEPLWEHVASRNLNQRHRLSSERCNQLFLVTKGAFVRPSPQQCSDELLIMLAAWLKEVDSEQRIQRQEAFLRAYVRAKVDDDIARLNYVNNLLWEVPVDRPGPPSRAELFLNLPRAKTLNAIVKSRLKHLKGKPVR